MTPNCQLLAKLFKKWQFKNVWCQRIVKSQFWGVLWKLSFLHWKKIVFWLVEPRGGSIYKWGGCNWEKGFIRWQPPTVQSIDLPANLACPSWTGQTGSGWPVCPTEQMVDVGLGHSTLPRVRRKQQENITNTKNGRWSSNVPTCAPLGTCLCKQNKMKGKGSRKIAGGCGSKISTSCATTPANWYLKNAKKSVVFPAVVYSTFSFKIKF